MGKLSMCRICLVENVRMYVITNKSLQQMYEKLTDVPFVTEDSRPMLACFFCCTKLKQCCRLQRKCLEAEELLAQMLSGDYEQRHLTNQEHLKFAQGLIISPIETLNIVEEGHTECSDIKQELVIDWEQQCDVELKVEHQSAELDPEHVRNIHPDVEDTTSLHSTLETEDEERIMKIKIEKEVEQEMSEQEHRVSKMENKMSSNNFRGRKLVDMVVQNEYNNIKERKDTEIEPRTTLVENLTIEIEPFCNIHDSIGVMQENMIDNDAPKGRTKTDNPRVTNRLEPLEMRIGAKKRTKFAKFKVKPACPSSCKKKCSESFSELERLEINEVFWGLSYEGQGYFIQSLVEKLAVKMRKKQSNLSRNNTYKYYFEKGDQKLEVCKIYFLTTLGFHQKNDRRISDALKKPLIRIVR